MSTTLLAAPRRARRLIHSGIAALLLTTVAGCGGDSGTGPTGPGNTNPVGLYSLRTVGKDAIPARIYRGPLPGIPDMTIGVTGGELTLMDDGLYALAIDLSLSANGQTIPRTVRFGGDYDVEGGTVTLYDGDGGSVDATLRNGVVTLELDMAGAGTVKQYAFKYVP